jgi:hypothetical protein
MKRLGLILLGLTACQDAGPLSIDAHDPGDLEQWVRRADDASMKDRNCNLVPILIKAEPNARMEMVLPILDRLVRAHCVNFKIQCAERTERLPIVTNA